MTFNAVDDALLDYQACQIDPENDRGATIVVATFDGGQLLAQARAVYFGEPQRVRQLRDVRVGDLRLALAWSVTAA